MQQPGGKISIDHNNKLHNQFDLLEIKNFFCQKKKEEEEEEEMNT